jgi:hypothetical protein
MLYIYYCLNTIHSSKCCFFQPSQFLLISYCKVYYFFRIVIVFCVIWLPGMLFVVFGTAEQNEFWIQIGLIFCGIQPIVSTCMAMTKSDVRKNTMDLITLSYIRTTAQHSSSEENTRTENNNEIIDI